jgi:hypothetical protein
MGHIKKKKKRGGEKIAPHKRGQEQWVTAPQRERRDNTRTPLKKKKTQNGIRTVGNSAPSSTTLPCHVTHGDKTKIQVLPLAANCGIWARTKRHSAFK